MRKPLTRLLRLVHQLLTLGKQFGALLTGGEKEATPAEQRDALATTFRGMFRADTAWLSSQVDSLRVIRKRVTALDNPTPIERFHRLLHGLHSMRASLILGAIMLFVPLTIALGYASLAERAGDSTSVDSLPRALFTLAAVLGGVAGLLFAVIVFGIQFHGERLGHASFAVRYLPRREGVLPIAALTLGVVGANAFVGLVATCWLPSAATAMAVMDGPLLLLVLAGALWLLGRMVVSVSGDFFEQSVKPGLAWEYQRAVDEEMQHSQLMAAYQKALEEAGLNYSMSADLDLLWRDAPIKFKLPGHGEVSDVNLQALRDLGRLVTEGCPGYEAELAVGPNDRVDGEPALVLAARRDCNDRGVGVPPLSQTLRERIDALLQQVFTLRRPRKREVVEVLSRFTKAIIDHAKYDQPSQLKPALDLQEHLIEQRLKRSDIENAPVSIYRQRLPDFLDDFAYAEVAEGAVASASRDKVEVVLIFAARVMNLAIESREPALFMKASGIVEAVYCRGLENESVRPWIGSMIDSWIHVVLGQFHGRRTRLFDQDRAAVEMPTLRIAIGWVLRLTKYALDADRRQDAHDFHDRLFEFDPNRRLRGERSRFDVRLPSELREVCDLHTYAQIALAGWCIFLARDRDQHSETVKSIFQRGAAECGTRQDLIRAWESMRGDSYGKAGIDAEFGLKHWQEPDRRWRSSTDCGALSSRDWLPPGFVLLGLQRPPAEGDDASQRIQHPPPITYDLGQIEATADALLSHEYVRNELLGLDDTTAREARDGFTALIRDRICLGKREALARIVDAPLSDERIEEVRSAIEEALNETRWFLDLIRRLGGAETAAPERIGPPVEWDCRALKEDFVANGKSPANLAELLAQELGEQESVRLAWALEQQTAVDGQVQDVGETAGTVRESIARLKEHGFAPSLILVPRLPHILDKLLGADWFGRGRTLGPRRLSSFEGIPVMEWPHKEPTSIAIVDVPSFYGDVGPPAAARPLTLEVQDRYHDENLALLEKAQSTNDPDGITSAHEVGVLAALRLLVGVGVADPEAAVRIDLDPKSLGYGMRRSDDLYHRPDCEVLTDADDVEFALATQLPRDEAPRTPCGTCKPGE